jgi:hypothetical protein
MSDTINKVLKYGTVAGIGAVVALIMLFMLLVATVFGGALLLSAGAEDPAQVNHTVNEEFTVGDGDKQASYRVNNVSNATYEGSEYIAIDIRVENVGNESITTRSSMFTLVDEQGREFETDDDLTYEAEIGGYETLSYEQIHPETQTNGTIFFEISSNYDNYRLRVEPVGITSGADEHYVELAQ